MLGADIAHTPITREGAPLRKENTSTMSLTPQKESFITKMQQKWGISSAGQVLLIIAVFSLAGSSAVALRKSFFSLLGFDIHTAFWLKAVAYVLFLFPTYQVLLLVYGTLLGQFRFFWAKEKKMLLAIRGAVTRIGRQQS